MAICNIYNAGRRVGMLITCGRHSNGVTDPYQCCKRVGTLGLRAPDEEVVRRLKRWYVAGHMREDHFPIVARRTSHIREGGSMLRGFADADPIWAEWTDERLDAFILAN